MSIISEANWPTYESITKAHDGVNRNLINQTSFNRDDDLSLRYQADIFTKNEYEQPVRSYKIRGAYNAMIKLTDQQKMNGVICASAGNHSQGFAAVCNFLNIKGIIYMPATTPQQKVDATNRIGNGFIRIIKIGDTFDEANTIALQQSERENKTFIPPFDDLNVIEGQGVVAHEIFTQLPAGHQLDYVFAPVGGGGLLAGIALYTRSRSPLTEIIGVEPAEAAAMYHSINMGSVQRLESISTFVDGAAVKKPGKYNFDIIKHLKIPIVTVPENRVCGTMDDMFTQKGLVLEPAGALSLDVLEDYRDSIRGKTVACIISGNNFDMSRYQEVRQRGEVFRGKQKYLSVTVPSREGALEEFLSKYLMQFNLNISYLRFTEVPGSRTQTFIVGVKSSSDNVSQFLDELEQSDYKFKDLSSLPDLKQIIR